jgi:hypothetical protein
MREFVINSALKFSQDVKIALSDKFRTILSVATEVERHLLGNLSVLPAENGYTITATLSRSGVYPVVDTAFGSGRKLAGTIFQTERAHIAFSAVHA